eukprot:SM000198S05319  [mRNA]  locus=s198:160554:177251:+ [translate_table: standard]
MEEDELPALAPTVAEVEAVLQHAAQRRPDPLLCFDLATKLLAAIEREPKASLIPAQRHCEDVLQSFIFMGVRPPVRRLVAAALVKLIQRGEEISIYSRASSLQGWLAERVGKRNEPAAIIGAAQCLGAISRAYGHKLTSGLTEIVSIVAKLVRYSEVEMRQAALTLLLDAVIGMRGGGPAIAYSEAVKVMRTGVTDRSPAVRLASAKCIRAQAMAGGPFLAGGGADSLAAISLKALEDLVDSVRVGYAGALGVLLALSPSPTQVPAKAKISPPTREANLHKFLIQPFIKASGARCKDIRFSISLTWVSFLQASFSSAETDLASIALQAMSMLPTAIKSNYDVHSQACVLYILRVGLIDQMGEAAQKELTVTLTKQLGALDNSPPALVVTLRLLSYLLETLGEVPISTRESLDEHLLNNLGHTSVAVRVEAARALRSLALVDPACATGLMSVGITSLRALRESVAVMKGEKLQSDLDSLHGQALLLASLVAASPKLTLGVPSRLPRAVLDVATDMISRPGRSISTTIERQSGWTLISAIVTATPKEELEEHEPTLVGLWSIPFGSNCLERLKKLDLYIGSELSVWASAMEALAAFICHYVVPIMNTEKDLVLLQPILTYLSGALRCLSSPLLQEGPPSVRPNVDLLSIHTLHAYRELSNCNLYKGDHVALLALCSGPFRDPAAAVGTSALRELLDRRDDALGPWTLGRDSLENELQTFEGGADGPLPTVWTFESTLFPQPLPQATVLMNIMLLTFCDIMAAKMEKNKLQLLDMILSSLKASRKQSWRHLNASNVSVALLGLLKASVGLRLQNEGEFLKKAQQAVQGILATDDQSPAHQRAASESLGLLARLGDDVYAARLARSLLSELTTTTDVTQKGAIALALGCIHRSVGGMALAALVPSSVQALCSLARDPSGSLSIWALHGLWLTAEAAGLSFVPHVQATLTLAMDMCILYTQQLVLFAPQALSVHSHVLVLQPMLSSRQPSLRQAAVATLRHLAERDPVLMVRESIEEHLFAMLDTETEERIVRDVRLTLERLLEAAGPTCPSRWLHLCRNVVLAISTIRRAGGDTHGGVISGEGFRQEAARADDGASMVARSLDEDLSTSKGSQAAIEGGATEASGQLPRFRTRLFAAECLSWLPNAVGDHPAHTDLMLARQLRMQQQSRQEKSLVDPSAEDEAFQADWLVLHLSELVALAYQVATGTMERVKPLGVYTLSTILSKFSRAHDPDVEGHSILEQYQAQLLSALRTAFDASAGPLLLSAGAKLAAAMIMTDISGGNRGVLQRLVGLMSNLLIEWDKLAYPSFAEWVGSKANSGVAHERQTTDAKVVLPLLLKHSLLLKDCWMAILKDYASFHIQPSSKMGYKPFLQGTQSPAAADAVRLHLEEAWPVVLEAITVGAYAKGSPDSTDVVDTYNLILDSADYHQLWALALMVLCEDTALQTPETLSTLGSIVASGNGTFGSFAEAAPPDKDSQLLALRALLSLTTPSFCSPEFLAQELCQELFEILQELELERTAKIKEAAALLVKQVIIAVPSTYWKKRSLALAAAEIGLTFFHRSLGSDGFPVASTPSTPEDEALLLWMYEAMETFATRLDSQVLVQPTDTIVAAHQGRCLLVPQLLCASLRALKVGPTANLASAQSFIINLANLASSDTDKEERPYGWEGQKEEVCCALLESLGAAVDRIISGIFRRPSISERSRPQIDVYGEVATRLPVLLTTMGMLATSLTSSTKTETGSLSHIAHKRCVACFLSTFTSPSTQVVAMNLVQQSRAIRRRHVVHGYLTSYSTHNCGATPVSSWSRLTGVNKDMLCAGTDGWVQALKALLQAGSAEIPRDTKHRWSLMCTQALALPAVELVYNACQLPLGSTTAGVLGEVLKVLLLLHSLVEGEDAQVAVLLLLLHCVVAVSGGQSGLSSGSEMAQAGLASLAVKLVTHLVAAPTAAQQFRTAVASLDEQSRQELQAMIRSSVPQQGPSVPTAAMKPPLPAATTPFRLVVPLPSALKQSQVVDFQEGHDDEWDDFRSPYAPMSSNKGDPLASASLQGQSLDVQEDRDKSQTLAAPVSSEARAATGEPRLITASYVAAQDRSPGQVSSKVEPGPSQARPQGGTEQQEIKDDWDDFQTTVEGSNMHSSTEDTTAAGLSADTVDHLSLDMQDEPAQEEVGDTVGVQDEDWDDFSSGPRGPSTWVSVEQESAQPQTSPLLEQQQQLPDILEAHPSTASLTRTSDEEELTAADDKLTASVDATPETGDVAAAAPIAEEKEICSTTIHSSVAASTSLIEDSNAQECRGEVRQQLLPQEPPDGDLPSATDRRANEFPDVLAQDYGGVTEKVVDQEWPIVEEDTDVEERHAVDEVDHLVDESSVSEVLFSTSRSFHLATYANQLEGADIIPEREDKASEPPSVPNVPLNNNGAANGLEENLPNVQSDKKGAANELEETLSEFPAPALYERALLLSELEVDEMVRVGQSSSTIGMDSSEATVDERTVP